MCLSELPHTANNGLHPLIGLAKGCDLDSTRDPSFRLSYVGLKMLGGYALVVGGRSA